MLEAHFTMSDRETPYSIYLVLWIACMNLASNVTWVISLEYAIKGIELDKLVVITR